MQLAIGGDALNLPLAEQRVGPNVANGNDGRISNHQADRQRKSLGLFEPRFGVSAGTGAANIRANN